MKASSKRGSAVLDAPEEMYASRKSKDSEVPWASSGAGMQSPAPAGALQRAYGQAYPVADDDEIDMEERPYVPVRGKMLFRFRGILKTVTGRVMLGVAAFLVLSAVATTFFVTRNYLLHDERFVIPSASQIETVGNTRLTRAHLLDVFGEDVERNIFKVPLEQRRADLERLPWVQHATVMRLLPNTLRVSIVERTPVAFVRQGSSLGLADATGVLLDMPASAAGDPHYSFPVLTGIYAADPLSTRAARMAIYVRFMKELESAGEKLPDTLSEVDISNPEDVKVIPVGGTDILVHLGDTDFLKRYRQFRQYLPEWKQQYPKLASADMRYDNQVVLDKGVDSPIAPAKDPAHPADAVVKEPAKPVVAKPLVAKTVAPKPVITKPEATKPVAVKAVAPPTAPKAAVVKARAVAPATHAPALKPANAVKVRTGAGKTSAANAKMFAALAAAARQQEKSGQVPR